MNAENFKLIAVPTGDDRAAGRSAEITFVIDPMGGVLPRVELTWTPPGGTEKVRQFLSLRLAYSFLEGYFS